MSVGRTLMRFVFLSAIGHQVTYTLVEGAIFEDARQRLSAVHPKADQFIRCHLCVGTWVGAVLAALYRPNLLADVEGRRQSPAQAVANVVAGAALIALGSRVWNEVLGWLRREVQVREQVIDGARETDGIELARPTPPGISLRSERNPGRGLSRI